MEKIVFDEPLIITANQPVEINIIHPNYSYAHGKALKSPKWIVVHYTACANVSAKDMCKAMRNNTVASSHFYVDENDICSAVPLNYIAWHVGDGQCKQPDPEHKMSLEKLSNYKCKDWRYDLAASNHLMWQSNKDDFLGNSCSIGVDICVKKKSTKTKKATDLDWYFDERAVDNTAKLIAYLMKKYGIDIDHVIRHGDSTGKLCAQPFIYPFDVGDRLWNEFKSKIEFYKTLNINAIMN